MNLLINMKPLRCIKNGYETNSFKNIYQKCYIFFKKLNQNGNIDFFLIQIKPNQLIWQCSTNG